MLEKIICDSRTKTNGTIYHKTYQGSNSKEEEKSKNDIHWKWGGNVVKGSERKWAKYKVYRNYKENEQ